MNRDAFDSPFLIMLFSMDRGVEKVDSRACAHFVQAEGDQDEAYSLPAQRAVFHIPSEGSID